MGRKWGLPLIVGIITFILLGIALWPSEPPEVEMVVAARDLGAGTVISPADLQMVTVEEDRAPSDAVTDPAALAGKTLSVVRFRGEPVTPRHVGPAVTLEPHERAIGVRVRADTAVGRLISPGAKVGVIATLEQDRETGTPSGRSTIYSKALLEGLRVLYVPPEFQARPYEPVGATASATFGSGSGEDEDGESGNSLLASQSRSSGSGRQADEGVIVLAVSTEPQKVTYESAETIASRQAVSATDTLTDTLASVPGENEAQSPPADSITEEEPEERYVIPVELLAALNANDASFTLVMMPEESEAYTTSGLSLDEIVVGPDTTVREVVRR